MKPLGLPDFRRFFGASLVSQTGSSITLFIVPVLLLQLSGSAGATSLGMAVTRIPFMVLGLFVGALADRVSRRALLLSADALRCVVSAVVALLCVSGSISVGVVIAAGVMAGVADTFFDVADNAAYPSLMPRTQLSAASSLSEGGTTVAELCGPALGGLIIAAGASVIRQSGLSYAIDGATFALSAILISRIRAVLGPDQRLLGDGSTGASSVLSDIREGLTYLLHHKQLRMLAMANFMNIALLSPIVVLSLTVGRSAHSLSPATIGLLISAGSVGGLVGALTTSLVANRLRPVQTMVVSAGAWALGALVLVLIPSLAGMVVAWGAFTLLQPAYFATLYSYRVSMIPDRLLGRVGSAFRVVSQAGGPVGLFLFGPLIDIAGVEAVGITLSVGFCMTGLIALTARQALPEGGGTK